MEVRDLEDMLVSLFDPQLTLSEKTELLRGEGVGSGTPGVSVIAAAWCRLMVSKSFSPMARRFGWSSYPQVAVKCGCPRRQAVSAMVQVVGVASAMKPKDTPFSVNRQPGKRFEASNPTRQHGMRFGLRGNGGWLLLRGNTGLRHRRTGFRPERAILHGLCRPSCHPG